MSIKDALEKIVGKENVSDTAEDLALYSRDLSLQPPGLANAVVWPANAEEVGKVVGYCNENNLPVVPVSSRVHLHGSTIPKQGGVVVDLKRLTTIHEIDLNNRLVRFDAGVTWEQLTKALAEKNMRCVMPLTPRPDRSVLTDFLEREVITNVVYDYGEPTQSMQVVWSDGTIFRMGSASVNGFPDSRSRGANPSGPGLDFYRFLQGAQGTMGIVTWMSLKIESIPKIDKVYFAPVDDLDYAQNFLYRVLPRRIGQECLLLNNVDLAAIVADKVDDIDALSKDLPPWTLILTTAGLLRRPEEKIAYEDKFLRDVQKNEYPKMNLYDKLPGFPGIGKTILPILRNPWPANTKHWKNRLGGGCQDIFFITRPNKVSEYIKIIDEYAPKYGYPINNIGKYVQPIEHNRAAHVEFSLFYDIDDEAEKAKIAKLNKDVSVALMNAGAFFSRPYGDLAPIVFNRAANYTAALKRVKAVFDPKNIMNPGNVCF
jgi:FAD/FMN-containing dehydrogenase